LSFHQFRHFVNFIIVFTFGHLALWPISVTVSGVENIVSALEHSNRVSETMTISKAMQVPFPAPTDPRLGSRSIPDSFLYLPAAAAAIRSLQPRAIGELQG
jgi:hypothetical protein